MRKLASIIGAFALLAVTAGLALGAYPTGSNANQAANWNSVFPHAASCFKHEAGDNSSHGYYSANGKSYTLNTFNQSWTGDHWEAIIVKAANTNLVTVHPTAGTGYTAFEGKDISHVIVCKGTTPAATPTPVPTATPEVTPTPTPEVTPTPTPAATPTPTPEATPTPTPQCEECGEETPTPTPSVTPSVTETPAPSIPDTSMSVLTTDSTGDLLMALFGAMACAGLIAVIVGTGQRAAKR